MVAVTYGIALAAARKLSASAKTEVKQGKGFLTRLFEAMIAARMKQAQRELALYSQLNFDWDEEPKLANER